MSHNISDREFRKYRTITPKLEAEGFQIRPRISHKGVPYLIINELVSVCWFGRTRTFKVFNPAFSEGGPQDRLGPFETHDEVISVLRTLTAPQLNV